MNSPSASGLDGIVVAQTALSEVDGERGRLVIRGDTVEDLVERATFEDVCGFMWNAAWPSPNERAALRAALSEARQQAYLQMLTGHLPEPPRVAALDAYLCCVVDHSMNASTFVARVVASTGSDLVSAVVAAIGALKGPLHGGAPGPVLDMLDAIGHPGRARAWLQAELAAGHRVMGMGHRSIESGIRGQLPWSVRCRCWSAPMPMVSASRWHEQSNAKPSACSPSAIRSGVRLSTETRGSPNVSLLRQRPNHPDKLLNRLSKITQHGEQTGIHPSAVCRADPPLGRTTPLHAGRHRGAAGREDNSRHSGRRAGAPAVRVCQRGRCG